MNVGDKVRLTAPDLLLEDGGTVFNGEKGLVIGHQGERVIVSWGSSPPYRVGTCRINDVAVSAPLVRRPQ